MVELLNSATAKVVVSESPDAAEFYRRLEPDRPRDRQPGRHRAAQHRGKKKTEVLFTNF